MFNPSLNPQKIGVFRSFQQNFEEISSLDHFLQKHIWFFDQVTTAQMTDAAAKVLKFTLDTLVNWFNSVSKQKYLEQNYFQKRAFIVKNPLDLSKTTCCIRGFMPSLSSWFYAFSFFVWRIWTNPKLDDFMVQQEYLFIKNIYSQEYIDNTDNFETLGDFYGLFEYFLEVVTLLKMKLLGLLSLRKRESLKIFLRSTVRTVTTARILLSSLTNLK